MLAEVAPSVWAAVTAAITLVAGTIAGFVTLRGNARSTTVQLDLIRAEANDELIKNLRQDNTDLRAELIIARQAESLWRSRFLDARDALEACRREQFGADHPEMWRYHPPE